MSQKGQLSPIVAAALGFLLMGPFCSVAHAVGYSATAEVGFPGLSTPACSDTSIVKDVGASTGCVTFSADGNSSASGDAFAVASTNSLGAIVDVISDPGLSASADAKAEFGDSFQFTNTAVRKVVFTASLDSIFDVGASAQATAILTLLNSFGSSICVANPIQPSCTVTSTVQISPPSNGNPNKFFEDLSFDAGIISDATNGRLDTVDARHTGFISLITAFDANGNVIPNPGLVADSGFNYAIGQVPEPGTLTLLGTGLLGVAAWSHRKGRKSDLLRYQ